MPTQFTLEVSTDGATVEALLNDIPIGVVRPEQPSPVVFAVSEFVISGENTLELLVHPGPTGSGARQASAVQGVAVEALVRGRAQAALHALPEGREPGFDRGDEIGRVEWLGPTVGTPLSVTRNVSVMDVIERWAWQSATRLSPDDALVRARVTGLVAELHSMLRAGEPLTFLTAIDRKVTEAARAYGLAREVIRSTVLQQFETRAVPPFALLPFEPAALDVRAAAGGRLLVCTVGNRQPVLRFEDVTRPGREFALPVMLGQIDGRLEVLR
jgi:hypothetical protein